MFKKYKIKRKKEEQKFQITKKEIQTKKERKEKSEIEKIKVLYSNKNIKLAFKKILKLENVIFEENIYFLTLTILAEYLNNTDVLLINCIKRIIQSNKFYTVEDLMFEYIPSLKFSKDMINFIIKHQYDFAVKCNEHFKSNLQKKMITYKLEDPIYLLR